LLAHDAPFTNNEASWSLKLSQMAQQTAIIIVLLIFDSIRRDQFMGIMRLLLIQSQKNLLVLLGDFLQLLLSQFEH
jgi:hypothetical protein